MPGRGIAGLAALGGGGGTGPLLPVVCEGAVVAVFKLLEVPLCGGGGGAGPRRDGGAGGGTGTEVPGLTGIPRPGCLGGSGTGRCPIEGCGTGLALWGRGGGSDEVL